MNCSLLITCKRNQRHNVVAEHGDRSIQHNRTEALLDARLEHTTFVFTIDRFNRSEIFGFEESYHFCDESVVWVGAQNLDHIDMNF